ncbi:hypothetical protein BHG93_13065 [Salmonella enterica]|nr:hypothetical protein [Salmonella enterica]
MPGIRSDYKYVDTQSFDWLLNKISIFMQEHFNQHTVNKNETHCAIYQINILIRYMHHKYKSK